MRSANEIQNGFSASSRPLRLTTTRVPNIAYRLGARLPKVTSSS
jgi:hypothetical protein